MSRPLVVDSVMGNNELDMLECRLTELYDAVDRFIVVEADTDHQGHPKPYHITENRDRFAQWKDKLLIVRATGLPTPEDDPDPWAREHAQREHVAEGLSWLDLNPDDIILHGDIDEIPTAVAARNVRPQGFLAFSQEGHFWSLRWRYPIPWMGTVAARAKDITSFGAMRDKRNTVRQVPGAGWHLSWLGGPDVATAKVGSFCHPEVLHRIEDGLASNKFLVDGIHVDGVQMVRCDVDATFPKFVREGRCPASWLL